ncbi:MAG: stage II sporulation protein M [Actinomycetota bacterium]
MSPNEYVLAQGIRDTRSTFELWQRGNWAVLGGWSALSLAIAATLLGAVWAVGSVVTPDPSPVYIDGINVPADALDVLEVIGRNALVLAFHATACVAGFIAGASMPIAARSRTGFSRWIHVKAGQFAITFVIAVTLFSLTTQAFVLGFQGATIADHLGITPGQLVLSVLPHALIELTALFFPLAAWIIASRGGHWNQLLAATFATVAIALPMLLIGALIEVYVWPQILISLSPFA